LLLVKQSKHHMCLIFHISILIHFIITWQVFSITCNKLVPHHFSMTLFNSSVHKTDLLTICITILMLQVSNQ
jgi:hypothetical protein